MLLEQIPLIADPFFYAVSAPSKQPFKQRFKQRFKQGLSNGLSKVFPRHLSLFSHLLSKLCSTLLYGADDFGAVLVVRVHLL